MRVLVLGIRGIPNVQGGVETHAEQLYAWLGDLGCEVEVLVRTPFVPRERRFFGKVRLRRLWAPRSAGLEALLHSLLGVLYAGISRPDVLHIHAIGPAIVTPLARLLGLRVVVTHHGPDYDREKWGAIGRWILRNGERAGMRFANARICISKVIVDLVRAKYGYSADLIPNGVVPAEPQCASEHVRRHGLVPGRYFLLVSRIVPEKRQLDLIEAFTAAQLPDWKLALVGGLGQDEYSARVKATATAAGVVLTGFLNGSALQQMYSHAGAFILPSSHEGLPIALLEALSYGLPVLASNIPAHLELGLEPTSYFPMGNVVALTRGLMWLSRAPCDLDRRLAVRQWVARTYDWDRIASQTLEIYKRVTKLTG